jgi:hypothetical protein
VGIVGKALRKSRRHARKVERGNRQQAKKQDQERSADSGNREALAAHTGAPP